MDEILDEPKILEYIDEMKKENFLDKYDFEYSSVDTRKKYGPAIFNYLINNQIIIGDPIFLYNLYTGLNIYWFSDLDTKYAILLLDANIDINLENNRSSDKNTFFKLLIEYNRYNNVIEYIFNNNIKVDWHQLLNYSLAYFNPLNRGFFERRHYYKENMTPLIIKIIESGIIFTEKQLILAMDNNNIDIIVKMIKLCSFDLNYKNNLFIKFAIHQKLPLDIIKLLIENSNFINDTIIKNDYYKQIYHLINDVSLINILTIDIDTEIYSTTDEIVELL